MDTLVLLIRYSIPTRRDERLINEMMEPLKKRLARIKQADPIEYYQMVQNIGNGIGEEIDAMKKSGYPQPSLNLINLSRTFFHVREMMNEDPGVLANLLPRFGPHSGYEVSVLHRWCRDLNIELYIAEFEEYNAVEWDAIVAARKYSLQEYLKTIAVSDLP